MKGLLGGVFHSIPRVCVQVGYFYFNCCHEMSSKDFQKLMEASTASMEEKFASSTAKMEEKFATQQSQLDRL